MNDQRSCTKAPAGDGLSLSDRGDLKECASKSIASQDMNHVALESHLKTEDHPEERIVAQCLEYILLRSEDDSAVDLVEEVHEDETVEDHGVQSHLIGCFVVVVSEDFGDQVERLFEEHHVAKVHKDEDRKHLIDDLADNVSPHFSGDDLISSADPVGVEFSV